jgi:transcriptional regulator with XRE-family HTH domain
VLILPPMRLNPADLQAAYARIADHRARDIFARPRSRKGREVQSWGPTYGSRSVSDRKIRAYLRKKRHEAGRTQRFVAENMDWSISKVTRVEGGDVGISTNDLRALLRLYEVHDEMIDELVAISHAARAPGPWESFSDVHSATFLRYLEFEAAASQLRKYNCQHIPGMLQTQGYGMAVMSVHSSTGDESQAERRWKARRIRQQHLQDENGPRMRFLLDEAAVRRLVGGVDIMRDQVRHLIDVSHYSKVELRIIPFEAGEYVGMRGPFILLDFDDPDLGPLLYIEPPVGEMHLVDAPDIIDTYNGQFDLMAEQAYDLTATRKLLCTIEAELSQRS